MKRSSIIVWASLLSLCFAADGRERADGRVELGKVASQEITEASGLVASRRTSGIYWTHNDSGDRARIFAIDGKGRLVAECLLPGVVAQDWEDIAAGPGPDGQPHLFLGDIGDNLAVRPGCAIISLPEPAVGTPDKPLRTNLTATARFFRYEDGPRDAETLLCDPVGGALYVVSKEKKTCGLYLIPSAPTGVVVAVRLATLTTKKVVAGDISPLGDGVLLKGYSKIYYWPLAKGRHLASALSAPPQLVPYEREDQDEAICWSIDARQFLTLPEGRGPHLYAYPFRRELLSPDDQP